MILRSVVCLLGFLVTAPVCVLAQGAKPAAAKPAQKVVKKVYLPQAYLGQSGKHDGGLKKDEFATLMRQGITAKDSLGNTYEAVGFEFGYAERALYEDSIGNLQILVDYMTEYCPGDTLSPGVSSSIYERVKVGDTLYFRNVNVQRTGQNQPILSKGMKFYIMK